MSRIFGRAKQVPRPDLNEAIQNVESRYDNVDKKIQKLDADLNKLKGQMIKMPEGPSKTILKQKAMRILQQKRMYEEQQGQLHQQMFNMDQTNYTIMGMKENQITYGAMKDGLKVMRKEYKNIEIDKIEKLQDEMADMLEMNNDINNALACTYNTPDVDEAELDAELAALSEVVDIGVTDTSYIDDILSAPCVPSTQPNKNTHDVEVDEFGLPKVPLTN